MECRLLCPEKVAFSGEAEMVVARSPHGEFGVMPGHAPMMTTVIPSAIRIKHGGEEKVFATGSGLLHAEQAAVTVAVSFAVPVEEIDIAELQQRRKELTAELEQARDDAALQQALQAVETQLMVADSYG